jgi:hypothetical protein
VVPEVGRRLLNRSSWSDARVHGDNVDPTDVVECALDGIGIGDVNGYSCSGHS